ncbi:Protein of unknown function [Singulisphaera sp. GP187]|uniref:tail completion protein gp17 n=1 Tax=Singulisphaera sp. GP187 TaxID=1882752 RepID=UPI0009279EAE|nr:DUF3168 domain-containing protein [Singulisphaera sp. GP187]SIO60144.1 Protein of unknown function [Singulisphaera sp. GP187]
MPIPVILTILRSQAAGPYVAFGFRAALATGLKSNAALTLIVGQRIFPQVLPQTAGLPALVYVVRSNVPVHNLSGAAGVTEARVEFRAYSTVNGDCDAILQVVRNQFEGIINGSLPGSIQILETVRKDEFDRWDPPVTQSDLGTYFEMHDYLFRYRESIPS